MRARYIKEGLKSGGTSGGAGCGPVLARAGGRKEVQSYGDWDWRGFRFSGNIGNVIWYPVVCIPAVQCALARC